MNLQAMEWNQPQICGECHKPTSEGYQELKYSEGGPHLEKRCRPCAITHYGVEVIDQLESAPEPKARKKAAQKGKESAPLLDRAG